MKRQESDAPMPEPWKFLASCTVRNTQNAEKFLWMVVTSKSDVCIFCDGEEYHNSDGCLGLAIEKYLRLPKARSYDLTTVMNYVADDLADVAANPKLAIREYTVNFLRGSIRNAVSLMDRNESASRI